MPPPFPSEDWTSAYAAALDESELAELSKDWHEGPIALVFGEHAALITPASSAADRVRHVTAPEARTQANLVIEASLSRWRELAGQNIDPVKFLMQGKLALTQGPLSSLLRDIELARALLSAVQRVPIDP